MSTALKMSLVTVPAAVLFAIYFLCTAHLLHNEQYFLVGLS